MEGKSQRRHFYAKNHTVIIISNTQMKKTSVKEHKGSKHNSILMQKIACSEEDKQREGSIQGDSREGRNGGREIEAFFFHFDIQR